MGLYGAGEPVLLRSFVVRRSALCGLHVAAGASLEVGAGTIDTAPFGVCLDAPVDGLDAVRFVDTQQRVNVTTLTVPDVIQSLDEI
jgi:hypothetical protein